MPMPMPPPPTGPDPMGTPSPDQLRGSQVGRTPGNDLNQLMQGLFHSIDQMAQQLMALGQVAPVVQEESTQLLQLLAQVKQKLAVQISQEMQQAQGQPTQDYPRPGSQNPQGAGAQSSAGESYGSSLSI